MQDSMQDYFSALAESVMAGLGRNEILACSFAGESSDFVRFNRSRVRQAGRVTQQGINLDLLEGRRHAAGEMALTGDFDRDRSRLRGLLEDLREIRRQVPDDPFLCFATEVHCSERIHPGEFPEAAVMVDEVLAAAAGRDLVGIYASGAVHAGFANSLGQRNWHTSHSFNVDWSLYWRGDKAVKAGYAGFVWDREALQARMTRAEEQLAALARPPRDLRPGRYRVYLAPAAVDEIIDLLGWGGFSLRAHRTGTTPLRRMVEDSARLHPSVSLTENFGLGVAPDFQEEGFMRPEQVALIENGAYRDFLVSPRSAAEYEVPGNGASRDEAPLSAEMAPGVVGLDQVAAVLDRGLYIGNLWYLNYSDRNAARLTGMTRFATFWVENGEVREPVNAMRFDETIYHLLGDHLLGLTSDRERLLDPSSYGARSQRGALLPGVLVDAVNFTL